MNAYLFSLELSDGEKYMEAVEAPKKIKAMKYIKNIYPKAFLVNIEEFEEVEEGDLNDICDFNISWEEVQAILI